MLAIAIIRLVHTFSNVYKVLALRNNNITYRAYVLHFSPFMQENFGGELYSYRPIGLIFPQSLNYSELYTDSIYDAAYNYKCTNIVRKACKALIDSRPLEDTSKNVGTVTSKMAS